MVVCQLDQSKHNDYKELNLYLQRLRYKQETYYHEYLPRKDLLTGETIPYKNIEQYLSQDFTDKRHLKKWIKENPTAGRIWAMEWLKKRKDEKGLIYAPSHVELRSLVAPSVAEFDDMQGGYNAICREIGLETRYERPSQQISRHGVTSVVADTREQNPLKIDGVELISAALNVGDYGLPEPHDMGIYIERKSLSDFIGTLGKGISRFARELERAKQNGHYVIMMVESNINDAFSFNYLPHINRHVRVQPSHIFKGLRDLLTLYPLHFQCIFVDGRVEAAEMVKVLLGAGEQVKKIDLQYALEEGFLS